jgi:two-component system, OmpR family, response regulator CpxR
MCVSVEMLLRCFVEKFVFDGSWPNYPAKMRHAHVRKVFNVSNTPLASTALYIRSSRRYDSSRSSNFLTHKIFVFPRRAAGRSVTSETRMKPKRTILCVDDNEQALSIRKIMLETRGYRVVACTGGREALERFKCGGVDLVLTDVMMPGLDGSRLIDEIKNLSPQTPAILLSGKTKIYDRDTRADVFLPKGMYAPVELLERIRMLLVRKRGPRRAHGPTVTEPAQISAA